MPTNFTQKTTDLKRDISDIKSALLRPATTSHFMVKVGLPSFFVNITQQRELNLMCSEAVLPGSQLATTEVFNDYTGVTERHAYRRIYDETIDLTFYVDAGNYLPIMFFETWMNEIVNEDQDDAISGNFNYRVKYPDDYVSPQGLQVIKFEKTANRANTEYAGGQLEYTFARSYPRSITSMPVNYDGSSLLKCSVQMTYLRYVVHHYPGSDSSPFNPFQQAQYNLNGFLSNAAANLIDAGITGSDVAGDIAGGFARRWVSNQLPLGSNDLLRSIQSGLA